MGLDSRDSQARGSKRANGERESEILGVLQRAEAALTPGEVAERLGAS